MNIDGLFLCCLIAGFVFSLFLFLTAGRFRFRFRIPGIRRFRSHRKQNGMAVPVPFGLFLTAFGISGLIQHGLFHWTAGASLAGATLFGVASYAIAGVTFSRFFADTAEPLEGVIQCGISGHVSLAIPEGGTGRIAFLSGGRRVTAPARSLKGGALPQGSRILIVEFKDRIALVDRL